MTKTQASKLVAGDKVEIVDCGPVMTATVLDVGFGAVYMQTETGRQTNRFDQLSAWRRVA